MASQTKRETAVNAARRNIFTAAGTLAATQAAGAPTREYTDALGLVLTTYEQAARAAGRAKLNEALRALSEHWEREQAVYEQDATPEDRGQALAAAAAVRLCLRELRALLSEATSCVWAQGASGEHDWVDATNEVVSSGQMCRGCGAIRATEGDGDG